MLGYPGLTIIEKLCSGGDILYRLLLIMFLSFPFTISLSLMLVGLSVLCWSMPPGGQVEMYVSGLSRPPRRQIELWGGVRCADL